MHCTALLQYKRDLSSSSRRARQRQEQPAWGREGGRQVDKIMKKERRVRGGGSSFFLLLGIVLGLVLAAAGGAGQVGAAKVGVGDKIFAGFSAAVPCKGIRFTDGMARNASIFTYCQGSPEKVVRCPQIYQPKNGPPGKVPATEIKLFNKFFPKSAIRWCNIDSVKSTDPQWTLCICADDKTSFPTSKGTPKPTGKEYESADSSYPDGSSTRHEYASHKSKPESVNVGFNEYESGGGYAEYEKKHKNHTLATTPQPTATGTQVFDPSSSISQNSPGSETQNENQNQVQNTPSPSSAAVAPASSSPNPLGIVAFIALTVVVLFFIYRRMRRRRYTSTEPMDRIPVPSTSNERILQSPTTDNERETSQFNRTDFTGRAIDRL